MSMKNPPHPGLSVWHDCLEPLGLKVTEAAKRLGVNRKQLSDIVTVTRASRLKWRSGSTRHLEAVPTRGCGSKLPTTWRKR